MRRGSLEDPLKNCRECGSASEDSCVLSAMLTVPWCVCRRRWPCGGRRCVRPAGSGRVQPELLKRMGLGSGSGAAGTDAAWESSVGWVGAGGLGASSDAREGSKARPGAVISCAWPRALGSGRSRPARDAAKLRGVCQDARPAPLGFPPPSPLPPVMCGPRVFSACGFLLCACTSLRAVCLRPRSLRSRW